MQSVDRRVPVFNVKTMEERLDAALAQPRFYTTAAAFFGGLALLLAVIGVYGVVSYSVAQRTREMGIRLALGTTPARLRASLLTQTGGVVAAGAAIGGLLVTGFARYLQTLVQGAASAVPMNMAFAAAITALVAAVAVWIATRHIVRLDVADVLRADGAD